MVKVGVFLGRFQPFHLGHAHILETMLETCQQVIILVGSADRHSSVKNPFDFSQRRGMIINYLADRRKGERSVCPVDIQPIDDQLYSLWKWKAGVVETVERYALPTENKEIVLYGHHKDSSSYYLDLFPEWRLENVENFHEVNATDIRRTYFESGVVSAYQSLPVPTERFMQEWKHDPQYQNLVEEWAWLDAEREKYEDYPYPETLGLMCADALVVCQGFVLLVRRGSAPGKDTWALPGGFKNALETFTECAVRELREETRLRVPEKILWGSIKSHHVFDAPDRSIGIPRITMAHYIEIAPDPSGELPAVRGSSDASQAQWVPLAKVLSMKLFDDHLDIVNHFL